jgi:hypothetical protein
VNLNLTCYICGQVEYLPVVYPSAREVQNPAEFAERVGFFLVFYLEMFFWRLMFKSQVNSILKVKVIVQ